LAKVGRMFVLSWPVAKFTWVGGQLSTNWKQLQYQANHSHCTQAYLLFCSVDHNFYVSTRRYIFGLSVHPSSACEHDILETAWQNFTKCTTLMPWGQRWTD